MNDDARFPDELWIGESFVGYYVTEHHYDGLQRYIHESRVPVNCGGMMDICSNEKAVAEDWEGQEEKSGSPYIHKSKVPVSCGGRWGMIKVYIASPYTIGDKELNVRKQIETAALLMDLEYNPFVPLLAHYQHILYPRPYEQWLENDLDWIRCCDVVLRLDGESKGADIEVAWANDNCVPVVYSIMELLEFYPAEEATNERNSTASKL